MLFEKPNFNSLFKLFYLIFFLILSLDVFPQYNTFYKIFYTDDGSWGSKVILTNDGSFVVIGSSSAQQPLSNNDLSNVLLIKVDSAGNTIWKKNIPLDYNQSGTSIKQTNDDGFIITGGRSNGGSWVTGIYKTNLLGDTVWTRKLLGMGGQNYGIDIIQTSDGKYMETGAVLMSGVNITKIDTDGTILWTNFYGITTDDGGKKIIETADKGFVVSGSCAWSLTSKIFIFKIDSTGNEKWKRYVGDIVPALSNDMIQTFDGGYIITGAKPDSSGIEVQMYILKTDSNGYTLWTKTYGNPDPVANSGEYGMSVVQCADSSFMVLYNIQTSDSAQVYLMKLSSNGDSLWSKKILASGDGRALIKTNDNGFAVTGYVYYNSNNVDAFLLKTDSLGNYINSVPLLNSANKEKAYLYPNPFNDKATLYLNKELQNSELIIYNLLGREENRILTIQSKEIIIERNNLPDGMYLYELRENKTTITTGKFIINTR